MKIKPHIKAIIIETETFEVGDFVCHMNNFFGNHTLLFFVATLNDVQVYSGKNSKYYKLIKLTDDK